MSDAPAEYYPRRPRVTDLLTDQPTGDVTDLPPGYRYPPSVVDRLADELVNGMDNETLYGGDEAVHAKLAGGYVLRNDPRTLAQAVLDHLGPLVATAHAQGARQATASCCCHTPPPVARDDQTVTVERVDAMLRWADTHPHPEAYAAADYGPGGTITRPRPRHTRTW